LISLYLLLILFGSGIDRWIYCHEIIPLPVPIKGKKESSTSPQYQINFIWSIEHNEKIQMLDGRRSRSTIATTATAAIAGESREKEELEIVVSDVSNSLFFYRVFPRPKEEEQEASKK
jgi:hypothetical protein